MMIIGQYSFNKRDIIGKGSASVVYKGMNQFQQPVAIKEIKVASLKNQFCLDLLASEIKIMKQLSHKNLVKLIDTWETKDFLYLITEYCNNGDLRGFIDSQKDDIPLKKIYQIGRDIAQGMLCCSQNNIMHRDLKPDNILLNQSVFKISDFGFATNQYYTNSFLGTPLYMAPQVLDNISQNRQTYSYKCDIWSFGIILYELIYKVNPFKSQNVEELKRKLLKPVQFPNSRSFPTKLKNLILSCFIYNEQERIDWLNIIKELNELICQQNQEKLLEIKMQYANTNKKSQHQPQKQFQPFQLNQQIKQQKNYFLSQNVSQARPNSSCSKIIVNSINGRNTSQTVINMPSQNKISIKQNQNSILHNHTMSQQQQSNKRLEHLIQKYAPQNASISKHIHPDPISQQRVVLNNNKSITNSKPQQYVNCLHPQHPAQRHISQIRQVQNYYQSIPKQQNNNTVRIVQSQRSNINNPSFVSSQQQITETFSPKPFRNASIQKIVPYIR